ncbi:MAG: PAM68 family protein [Pseudanabaenaceae cyanobacterium bins.68]|nr:PAM68 family protein [Pseudanabaenaceae cyanobacterium bins.68]
MQRIPFEPNSKKKRAAANSSQSSPPNKNSSKKNNQKLNPKQPSTSERNNQRDNQRDNLGIPKTVSDRMVRRSALFCGIPTGLGFMILIASYIVVSRHLLELPNTLVLFFSLGLTGIGVLGLSYGALSASWDEDRLGSWWGAAEFQRNFSYLTAAWRNQRNSPPDHSP